MHDSRGQCSEKGPSLARSSRGAFPKGDLQGFSDAWRAYPAKASSFRMHGAHILPRTGDFPVRGHFWDAWSEKIATARRPGTHRARILPPPVARERISRRSCHGRMPGFASRRITTALPQNNAKGRIRGTPPTKTKEGERTARLLSLFSFTARVAQDLRSNKPPTLGIPLGWGFRVRRNCASRPIC